MIVTDLVSSFVEWCARHRKPATVKHYKDRLSSFVKRFGDRPFSGLTPLEVDAWLYDAGHWPADHPTKAGQAKAPDTLRANAITFERLQQWAIENKLVAAPITNKLEKPRGRLRERIPTEDEIAKILKLAPKEFVLIFQALKQCGARPNELCRAQVEDWNVAKGEIVLADHKTATKTGKPRVIGVGKRLEELIIESLKSRMPRGRRTGETLELPTSGPLFVDATKKGWTPAKLSEMFRKLRDRAGLPKDLCLYLTRHWHATMLCRSGVSLFEVAASLGHADIKTTQRYTHTTTERLRENQDRVA